MSDNSNLNQAAAAKNDEFYTQRKDIEAEMAHHAERFRGKVVYCPCDDYRKSQFWAYFKDNFERLGLQRLIASCHYPDDLFTAPDAPKACWAEYAGEGMEYHGFHRGDGGFETRECMQLMRHADIIVTNPPFSLFRDFVATLTQEQKEFIIVGFRIAFFYDCVWRRVRDGTMWIGKSKRGMYFETPEDGLRHVNAGWFTSFVDYDDRARVPLTRRYDPEAYPRYRNADAIEVSRTLDIPADYEGSMGVPVSFLDKYHPDQFEIVGVERVPMLEDGTSKYSRILIRHRKPI